MEVYLLADWNHWACCLDGTAINGVAACRFPHTERCIHTWWVHKRKDKRDRMPWYRIARQPA